MNNIDELTKSESTSAKVERKTTKKTPNFFKMISEQPTLNEFLVASATAEQFKFDEKINNASIEELKKYKQVLEPKGTLDKVLYLLDFKRAHKYDVVSEVLYKKTEVRLRTIIEKIDNLEKELCGTTFKTIADGFVKPQSQTYYDEFKNQPADELQKQSKLLIARTSAPREGVPTYFCDLAKRLAISKILLEREYKELHEKYRT